MLTCFLFNRPSQITDAAGTHIPQYSETGQFEGETITGGVLDGFSTATGYDSLLRKNAFSVSRGSTVLAESGWGYDALSRMETVTQGTDSATSTYHANSSLPDTLTHKRGAATVLTTGKTFDALGRLETLIHTPATGPPVSFTYGYNAAGLRSTVTLADNSFWSVGYNDRGEVISGVRKAENQTPFPGQDFGYQFDSIGNRLTATVNGRVSTYTPNTVNAYESRTVPGYLNILGEAASDADVTVNATTAERLGNYFRAELAVDNTTAPVQATVTTVATLGQETATVISQRFLPKTPEIFNHDADGNLISDGRWTNVWDAENRLVQQTATASSVAAGAMNLRLAFTYDYAGRRIKKTVSEWDGTAWAQKYSLNYLYDGWNLVAEVAANGGPTLRSYAWRADLSGGDTAGGIGGLAFIRFHLEGKTLAVASDAQGNISALYDMEDASLVAIYEYGPFGEPLRASGPFAAVNPFRFSTKYEDPETGWLYYGYRFYIPELGRWASLDSIGEEGGINLNAFVGNNPVNWVDPWGLEAKIFVYRTSRTSITTVMVYENGKYLGGFYGNLKGYLEGTRAPDAGIYTLQPKDNYDLGDPYVDGTPSITKDGLRSGQPEPGAKGTHRVHPEGESKGCLTGPQVWADRIWDIMDRNMDDGGTFIHYVNVDVMMGLPVGPRLLNPIKHTWPGFGIVGKEPIPQQ